MKLNLQRRAVIHIMVVALTVFFCSTPPSWAAEGLLVVNSALNMLTTPLWVAKEKDYFHKYGIDVDTIYIPSGTMGTATRRSTATKARAAEANTARETTTTGEPKPWCPPWMTPTTSAATATMAAI